MTETLEEFRTRARGFLSEHATGITVRDHDDPRHDLTHAECTAFQRALFDAGLAGLTYPVEYGGQGLTPDHQRIWREEAANFPLMTRTYSISHGMCLPMLDEYGTPELRSKYQASVISGDELWCQMFSEPGAGSDVASLQMRAVRDGDEWIINGQKVWTTLAHIADKGIVIARTDPDQPKHRGISMFIIDMHDPAVEVRQIHQIDGGGRFNEVYLTDLRVPADHQIGPLNEGWRLATAMLMYERVAIGTGQTGGIATPYYDTLSEEAVKRGSSTDPIVRQELMRLYSAEVCQSLMSMRTRSEQQAGKTPGPGGSLGKLIRAEITSVYRDLSLQIVGPGSVAGEDGGRWSKAALTTLASRIAGGTNEIQRNIIGERVLGLPREPSVDKDLPFKDLKVGTQRID
ncbi:MAG: acyl-CoA dehydrogenase family protein [Actinomycetota bacterium]